MEQRAGTRGTGRVWRVWVPILSFLAGVGLTAAVVAGLAGLGNDAENPASQPSPVPTSPTDAAASGSVPPSCLEAAEYNQTFTTALDEIAIGVRDQDARALQEALDAVQDAQPGSEAASQECRDLAGAGGEATDDGSESDESAQEGATEPEESPTDPTPTP